MMAGGAVLWAVAWGYERATGVEGMGFGDVKLLAMIGAFVGWQAIPAILIIASVAGSIAGIGVIVFTVARYAALPDPVPTHFALMGEPDGWSRKSVGAVMVLPIMTLVMGVVLGGSALLIARAKRGLRLDDGASLVAQNRYRTAMSRFLAVLGLLVTAMLASLSVGSVQVALGDRPALPFAQRARAACIP